MEPEVLNFLKRVGKSLGIGLLWLCITVTAALKNDNAFPDNGIRLANVLFYTWLVVSVIFMVRIFQKLWTADENQEE